MEVFKDVGFWGPAFGFLSASVVSARYIIRYWFASKKLVNDKFVKDTTLVIQGLQQAATTTRTTLSDQAVTLANHESLLSRFNETTSRVEKVAETVQIAAAAVDASSRAMAAQYNQASDEIQAAVKTCSDIKTEIIQISKDYIFVTSRKKA